MTDTQNPGGWPDAARPGVPMEPNESRYHWLARKGTSYPGVACFPSFWNAADEDFPGVRDAAERFDYLGPCPLPAEVEAEKVAARREALEEAAKEVDCGCAIRAAVLERLEAQGQKQASYLCQHGDVCCALQAAEIRALLEDGR